MNGRSSSFPAEYFERLYADADDPWNFAESEYERHKYAATLEALPRRAFHRGFEVGCSIGVFTRQLAASCESLLAVDISETALERAKARCRGLDHVQFQRMQIPNQWAEGRFDLLLLSEVLYFLDLDDIRRTASQCLTSLSRGGVILLVHWTKGTNYPCGGDEAVDCFIGAVAGNLTPIRQHRQPEYRLDLLG